MGRRSQHTQAELKEMILAAARKGVEEGNGVPPSARDIAREIGYAPGTLYNVFQNLDAIMLHVEAQVLGELDAQIGRAVEGRKGAFALRRLAAAYVEFAYSNPQLWRLVQEHHPADNKVAPDWYRERLYAPMGRIEALLGKTIGDQDADEVARAARLVWSAIHGIVQVTTTAKFGVVPVAMAVGMAEEVVDLHVNANAGKSPIRKQRESGRRAEHDRRA